jgi:signal transduction histidine kinase
MELLQNDNSKERGKLFRVEMDELRAADRLPLAATFGFDEIKTCTVASRADAERLTGKAELPGDWLTMPEDDLESLMPRLLMGLQYALRYFCNSMQGVYFESFGLESVPDKALNILLYRCTRELVNNALQHAGATCVLVQLSLGKGTVSVTVHDNGCGFSPETAPFGSGLGNVCACVLACNGQLNFFTSEGEGTEITIEIQSPHATATDN